MSFLGSFRFSIQRCHSTNHKIPWKTNVTCFIPNIIPKVYITMVHHISGLIPGNSRTGTCREPESQKESFFINWYRCGKFVIKPHIQFTHFHKFFTGIDQNRWFCLACSIDTDLNRIIGVTPAVNIGEHDPALNNFTANIGIKKHSQFNLISASCNG